MRFAKILLLGIGRFSFSRKLFHSLIREIALKDRAGGLLNSAYNKLNYEEKEIFHLLGAKIFRSGNGHQKLNTVWPVRFAYSTIRVPIRGNEVWLHWDTAISLTGHDIEIKHFYEQLITSRYRPNCFFDVGANYGVHSILFLANGIQTISFEPNPNCESYFRQMAQSNNLSVQLEHVAVGNDTEVRQLVFPPRDTWLGTLSDRYADALQQMEDVVECIDVQTITLDDYAAANRLKPDLIKIDTEGYELNVLQGAKNIMNKGPLLAIFESNYQLERAALLTIFRESNYTLFNLRDLKHPLGDETFLHSPANNFLAVSPGHGILKDIRNYAL